MDKYIVFDFPCGMQKRVNWLSPVRGMRYNGNRPMVATIHGTESGALTGVELEYVLKEVFPSLDSDGLVGYDTDDIKPKSIKTYKMKDYI